MPACALACQDLSEPARASRKASRLVRLPPCSWWEVVLVVPIEVRCLRSRQARGSRLSTQSNRMASTKRVMELLEATRGDHAKAALPFAARHLHFVSKIARANGVECEMVHAHSDDPAGEILKLAMSRGCDLIVKGIARSARNRRPLARQRDAQGADAQPHSGAGASLDHRVIPRKRTGVVPMEGGRSRCSHPSARHRQVFERGSQP